MELQKINLVVDKTTPAKSTLRLISFNFKFSSKVTISRGLVVAMGLKKGDRLNALQDKKNPKDIYLQLDPEGDLVVNQAASGTTSFSTLGFKKTLVKELGVSEIKIVRIMMGVPFEHEGKTTVGLITSALKP